MSTMICECGKYGIYWKNLTTNPYTYCPNCGGTNCQKIEPVYYEEDDTVQVRE